MITPRLMLVAALGLSACATAPNDVSPGQQVLDQSVLDARQSRLNGLPPETGVSGGQISSVTGDGLPTSAGATGDVTFLDPNSIEGIAAGAIQEAEAAGQGGGVFDNIQPQSAEDVLPTPIIPRVASFALRTTHQPGQQVYRRNPLRRSNQALCANYERPDLAQNWFLSEGGPERDPNGLDPDGDGFVCGFNPNTIRAEAASTGQ